MRQLLVIAITLLLVPHLGWAQQDSLYLKKVSKHFDNGDIKTTLTEIDSLLDTYKNNESVQASLYMFRAKVYGRIADRHKQLNDLLEARAHFKEANDKRGHAEAMHQLGRYFLFLNQYQQSQKILETAYTAFEKEKDVRGVARVRSSMGLLALRTGDVKKSILLLRQSIEKADSAKDLNESIRGRLRLSQCYHQQMHFDSMMMELKTAQWMSGHYENKDIQSRILAELGAGYLAIRQFDSARMVLNKALEMAIALQGKRRELMIYRLLAKCSQYTQQHEQAYAYLAKADSLTQFINANEVALITNAFEAIETNTLLKEENLYNKRQTLFFIVLSVILLAGLFLVYRLFRKTKDIVEIEKEKTRLANDTQEIMSSLPEIITGFDTVGNITFLNKPTGGVDPASAVGKNIKELIGPLEYERRMKFITASIEENKEVSYERVIGNKTFHIRTFPAKLASSNTAALSIYTDITKARSQEQILAWVSEVAKIGGWEMNLEKHSMQWSDEIYKIHEVDIFRDLTVEAALDYYTSEARPTIQAAISQGIEKGIPWNVELPIVTAKGNKKWIRDIGIPEMTDGKCKVIRGVLQDITDKKNTELAIQKREQELELAIRGGDLGTWNWDILTGYVSFNDRIAQMLGYKITGAPISTWSKSIHPDDQTYVKEILQSHLNGDSDYYEAEYRLQHKKGHWVWILDRGKVIEFCAKGTPRFMSGTYMDITQRKEVELENFRLQFELEEFKSAVNVSTIVSITDKKGTIKYANHKFTEISKYGLSELIGKKHNVINSGHHPKSFWKEMWQTIGRGEVWRSEVRNKRKDGTFYWVDTFIIPLRNTENEIIEYLSIRNDITDKKENEIELQNALKRAQESDHLKAAFLANISHEIRTPMNAIMGFAELLERPHIPDHKRAEFSKLIHERSQNLLSIVNDILDVSKIEAGQISSVPVVGNIKELLDHFLTTYKAEIFHLRNQNIALKIVNGLQPCQWVLSADFLRLNQVLNNLLSNAVKFTSNGTIELGCKLSESNQLLFWVRDTGTGIPAEQLEAIFLPFRQADLSIHQQYGGSGLGLAISKGLVELWGGTIWVESEVGTGSVFYFTLPYEPVTHKKLAVDN